MKGKQVVTFLPLFGKIFLFRAPWRYHLGERTKRRYFVNVDVMVPTSRALSKRKGWALPSGLTKALEKEEAKESWNMRFLRGSLQQCKGKGLDNLKPQWKRLKLESDIVAVVLEPRRGEDERLIEKIPHSQPKERAYGQIDLVCSEKSLRSSHHWGLFVYDLGSMFPDVSSDRSTEGKSGWDKKEK